MTAEKSPKRRAPRPKKQQPSVKHQKGSGFWIGLICFSSMWMFILGILVGRGTAPVQFDIEKLEKELIALKEIVLKKEKEQIEHYANGANNTTGLEFHEDLKQPKDTEDFLTANTGIETGTPEISEEVISQEDDDDTVDKISLAKKTKKEYQQGVNLEEPASDVTTKPANLEQPTEGVGEKADPSKYQWTIQVASLKDPAAANKIVEVLRQKGYAAYSTAANVAGKGMWYRVRVGPFRDKDPAQKELDRLKKDNYNPILISL